MKIPGQDFFIIFASIFVEALPFIVLGSLVAGILEHTVPQRWITRLVPRNRPLAIVVSCLLGLVFPMCECGIVPVMRRLLRKGLPLSCCVAYMMCGPIINLVVISSTVAAFYNYDGGWVVVALRIGLGFIVGFTTALVIDRMARKHGNELLVPTARPDVKGDDHEHGPPESWMQWLGAVSATAIGDFVDIAVFLTLGALLSAFARIFVTTSAITAFGVGQPILAIGAMIVLAIVLCLCSEADAFVAASFSTMPLAPKVAFLVLGPMLDIKLLILFTRVFRPRVIWTIAVCAITLSYGLSIAVHFTLPTWYGSEIPHASTSAAAPSE